MLYNSIFHRWYDLSHSCHRGITNNFTGIEAPSLLHIDQAPFYSWEPYNFTPCVLMWCLVYVCFLRTIGTKIFLYIAMSLLIPNNFCCV